MGSDNFIIHFLGEDPPAEKTQTPNAPRPNYVANNEAIRTHMQNLQRQWMQVSAAMGGGPAAIGSSQLPFEQNVNGFLDEVSWFLGLNS